MRNAPFATIEEDPDSVLAHHRRLIELRHREAAVTDGDFALLLADHPTVWTFLRRGPHAELLVAANLSGEQVEVSLPLADDWTAAEPVLANLPRPPQPSPNLALRPWEAVVWRR
jgi:oligo-1,6-glucosidase